MIGIVDAHHHIWRRADLPWLVGPMQPRIFGPYEPIRRDYPIREYLDDLAGNGVVKSVYVQTNWPKERYEDETAWVQRTSEETGWPHAIVAYADFGADDVRPQFDRLNATDWCVACVCNCTGTRTRSTASPRAPICARTRPSAATSRGWLTTAGASIYRYSRRRCRTLPALPKPVRKSRSCCSTPVCSRTLTPAGRSAWRAGMVRLAACPNIVCKLSGLGTFIHRNDPAHVAGILVETVAIFGADRCLFGSNFPIEKLWTSYRDLVDAYLDATKLNPHHRDAILRETAMRVYRLAP